MKIVEPPDVKDVRLKLFDGIFLALSLAAIILSFWIAYGHYSSGGPAMVQIESASGTYLYPLSQNRDLEITGPAGTTHLRIEDGFAYAVDSPGPKKIMMLMGKINQAGQWIASLPNRVFVCIIGGTAPSVDVSVF